MSAYGTDRPRGAALVIVMLVMAVLLLAGTTFLTISSTESQIALNQQASAQALMLADAGLHKALAQLDADPTYTGETNTSLGSGTFTIRKLSSTTVPVCTATATEWEVSAAVPVGGGQSQAMLRATLDQVSYPFRWGAYGASGYLSFGSWFYSSLVDGYDSSLEPVYDPNASHPTGGNIGANGTVSLMHAQVNGNVKATGTISSWSSSVGGYQLSGAPDEVLPSVSPPGSLSCSPLSSPPAQPLTPGTYCYSSVQLGDGASITTNGQGPVTIYVTGNVSLGNNVTLKGVSSTGSASPTNLTIIAKSSGTSETHATFSTGRNFKLYGAVYGTNTDLGLGGAVEVYGSIIARSVSNDWGGFLGKGPEVHLDQALANQRLCHNGKYRIVRGTWREVNP